MKKKLIAIATAASCCILSAVTALAANSDYVGSYFAYDISGNGYTTMNITSCTDSEIVVEFEREKDNVKKFEYTFEKGTMDGTDGTIAFSASTGTAHIPGTMTLSLLSDGRIKVLCVSDQGETFFEGTLTKSHTVDEEHVDVAPSGADVKININGTEMVFSDDIKPYIINDFTYVPLRSVFNTMGINVYWDQYQKNDIFLEQLISCTKNDTIVQFARTLNNSGANTWTLRKWVGKNTDSADFENLDIILLQPVLIGESSYIPLRVVSEAFGAQVDWVNDTRTVVINCDTSNEYKYEKPTIDGNEDFTQLMAHSYITPDYTAIVPNPTPYFAPYGKYYIFTARDQWNDVVLKVSYGGYIDVVTQEKYLEEIAAPILEATPTPTESTEINNEL